MKRIPTAILILVTVFVLFALVAAVKAPAHAQSCSCGYYLVRVVKEWPDFNRTERRCYRCQRATRVYSYERREDDPPRAHCLWDFPPIRATGDDKLEEDRAQISAQDRWSIEVETRHGTRFSDIRFSARATSACARKVPTSATEKGQAVLGIRHFACVYEATPCAAPKLPVDEDSRAKRSSEKRDDETGRKADPRADFYEPQPEPKKRWYQRRREDR